VSETIAPRGRLEMSTARLRALFDELVLVETRLRASVDARLRDEFGLPIEQFELLSVVAGQEACQVRDIVAALSLATGGASKHVDRAEEAGLCRRRSNRDDRRSSIIELTPAGARLLARASEEVEVTLQSALGSAISPASLEQFATLLEALRAFGP
jgi:MarR family transcriptional regulator, organic hydroperoxide resistance regulator